MRTLEARPFLENKSADSTINNTPRTISYVAPPKAIVESFSPKKSTATPTHKPISSKNNICSILSIGFCLFILAAIALPCFIGAREKAVGAAVKGNMRTVQIAAESYATDNQGLYPTRVTQLLPYMPGGSNTIGGKPGIPPVNPMNCDPNSVVDGTGFRSSEIIAQLRSQPVAKSNLKPGQIAYSAVGNGSSYLVMGCDPYGMNSSGIVGNNLVLSNQ